MSTQPTKMRDNHQSPRRDPVGGWPTPANTRNPDAPRSCSCTLLSPHDGRSTTGSRRERSSVCASYERRRHRQPNKKAPSSTWRDETRRSDFLERPSVIGRSKKPSCVRRADGRKRHIFLACVDLQSGRYVSHPIRAWSKTFVCAPLVRFHPSLQRSASVLVDGSDQDVDRFRRNDPRDTGLVLVGNGSMC